MSKIISLPYEFIQDKTIPSKVKRFLCLLQLSDPLITFASEVKKVWELLNLTYPQFLLANKWCRKNKYSHFIGLGTPRERRYRFVFIPLVFTQLFLLFFVELSYLPFEAQILFAHIFKLCQEDNDYTLAHTNKYFEALFRKTQRPIEHYLSLLFKEKIIIRDPTSEKMSFRRETEEPNVYETVFVEHRKITLSPHFLKLRKENYSEFYLQALPSLPQQNKEKKKNKSASKTPKVSPNAFADWSFKAVQFIDQALPLYLKSFEEKRDLSMTRVVFLLPILESYFKEHCLIKKRLTSFIDSLTVEEIHRLSPKRFEGKIFDMLAEIEIDENKLFSKPLKISTLSLKRCVARVEKIYSQLQQKPKYHSSLSIFAGMKKIRKYLRHAILQKYLHLKKSYSVRFNYLEASIVFGVFYTLFSMSPTLIEQLKEIWEKTVIPKSTSLPLEGEELADFYLSKIVKYFQTSLTLPIRTFLTEGDFKLFPHNSESEMSSLASCIQYSCRFYKNKIYKEINYQRERRAHMWQEITKESPDKRYFYNLNDPTPYLLEYNKKPKYEEEVGERIYFVGSHPFWTKEHLDYPDVYVQEDLVQIEELFPRDCFYEVKEYVKNLYLTEKIGLIYNLNHWAKTTYDSVSTSKEFIHRKLYKKRKDAFIQAALRQPERFSFNKQNEMLYCTLSHASIVSLENNEWWKEVFNL